MNVEWSEKAVNRASEIMTFMEENYSILSAQKFHLNLWETVEKAQKYPTMGSPSAKVPNVRSMKIDKYRKLFFEMSDPSKIIILDIFDTRQNPEKLLY